MYRFTTAKCIAIHDSHFLRIVSALIHTREIGSSVNTGMGSDLEHCCVKTLSRPELIGQPNHELPPTAAASIRYGHDGRLPRPLRPLRRRHLLRVAEHRLLRHQLPRRSHARGLRQAMHRSQKGWF